MRASFTQLKGMLRLPIEVTVENLIKLSVMMEWGKTSSTIFSSTF